MWLLPPLPALRNAPWAGAAPGAEALPPAVTQYDYLTPPGGDALQIPVAPDADVSASLAAAREAQSLFPPPPAPPPAPASVYPAPSETSEAASSVRYRCDGYRRAARAKP